MRRSLQGLLFNAAAALEPRGQQRAYYAEGLREVVKHLRQVDTGEATLAEFLDCYCIRPPGGARTSPLDVKYKWESSDPDCHQLWVGSRLTDEVIIGLDNPEMWHFCTMHENRNFADTLGDAKRYSVTYVREHLSGQLGFEIEMVEARGR